MGMSAGGTLVPLYTYGVADRSVAHHFRQLFVITGKSLKTSGCTTEGTGTVRQTYAPDILFKPSAVGKGYLIQLAKDFKKTYHR